MSKTYLGYTAIEWAVAALILLLLAAFFARIIFGEDIRDYENQFFDAIGLSDSRKYALLGPLVAWWGYSIYSRESKKAKAASAPVVRPVVAVSAALALVLALVLLFLVAR